MNIQQIRIIEAQYGLNSVQYQQAVASQSRTRSNPESQKSIKRKHNVQEGGSRKSVNKAITAVVQDINRALEEAQEDGLVNSIEDIHAIIEDEAAMSMRTLNLSPRDKKAVRKAIKMYSDSITG